MSDRSLLAARLSAAVWGHLVGDAVGVPYEFRSAGDIGSVEFGAKGTHGQPPGTWSDDGALMLALLDSLLTAGFDPENQAKRALDWYRHGSYTPDGDGHFDVGNTTRQALQAFERGMLPEQAGRTDKQSGGNGSLMRILPLALVERDVPDEQLIEDAHLASRVTHGHERPQVACALYSLVVRRLLSGVGGRKAALADAQRTLRHHYETMPDSAAYLEALDHLEGWPERAGRGRVWDTFWSAWDAFAGADSYQETIERAVRYGNDTDTTAAIAGGLAGIRWGIDGIPPAWLARMRGRRIVVPLIDRLLDTAGQRTSTLNPIRVDWIDTYYIPLVMHAHGRLGMTFLPGKRSIGQAGQHWRDLDADVDRLRDEHKADSLVLLVEDQELERFGVSRMSEAIVARGIELLRYPIRDGDAPSSRQTFRRLLDRLIGGLLSGASVVVACRGGLGRSGLLVACLLRDLGDYEADAAIELTEFARHGAVETTAQRAFVAGWKWPRRAVVARALTRRRKAKAAEQAAESDTMTPEEISLERLWLGLRQALRRENLKAAYLVQPPDACPARIVCYLVEPSDQERVVRLVRTRARRYVKSKDLDVVVGEVDGSASALFRIVPAPAERLGE
jgi:ADP-ribosyl-[dinitrogen reductase] hydrolase